MQQSNRNFSPIGMALCFCAINLGAALTASSGNFSSGSGKIPMFAHMAGVFAVAAVLSFSLWRGPKEGRHGFFRPLPLLLLAVSLVCTVMPLSVHDGNSLSWRSLVPPALALCMFLPVGLYAFFTTAPTDRQGLYLGLGMSMGELVWIVALPPLYMTSPGFEHPGLVLYIYKLLGLVMAAAGLCFAISFAMPPGHPSPGGKNGTGTPLFSNGKTALLLFFGAGACFYLLFGASLLGLPRASENPTISGVVHFSLTTIGPLAGFLLDRALNAREGTERLARLRRYFLCFLAPCVLAVPLLGFMTGFAQSGLFPVFLLAIRQTLLLSLLVLGARLGGTGPLFPLLASLVWGFMLIHLPGIKAGQFLGAFPGAQLAAVAGLTLCTVLFIARASAALALPPHTEHEPDTIPHTADPEAETAKLRAFVATFGLTKREHEVLDGFLRHLPPDTLRETLGISDSTIRFHQSGMLRKTGMTTKRRLLHFYTIWTPE